MIQGISPISIIVNARLLSPATLLATLLVAPMALGLAMSVDSSHLTAESLDITLPKFANENSSWVSIESMEDVDSVSPDGRWATRGGYLIDLANGTEFYVYTGVPSMGGWPQDESEWCGALWSPDSSRVYLWTPEQIFVHLVDLSEIHSTKSIGARHCSDSGIRDIPNFVMWDYTIVYRDALWNIPNKPQYSCIYVLGVDNPDSYNQNPFQLHCRSDYLDTTFELIGFSADTGSIIGISGDLILIDDQVYDYDDAPEDADSVWKPSIGNFTIGVDGGLIGVDNNQDGFADYWDYDSDGVVSISDQCPLTPIGSVVDYGGCSWGQYDDDEDGFDNILDKFPDDACAHLDTDDDGKPDDVVSGCSTSLMMDVDDDNDGYDDREDDCPTQGNLFVPDWIDNDGDGDCDEHDDDDDNDGYSDLDESTNCDFESNPKDSGDIPPDYDRDLICDFRDSDDDNDGWGDTHEASCNTNPLNGDSTPIDTDGDGICDYLDTDDDNDGYVDSNDAFPLDPDEHMTWWDKLLEFLFLLCCVLPGLLVLMAIAPKP